MKQYLHILGRFFVMAILGTFNTFAITLLILTGRIRIYGYWRLIQNLNRGKIIIAANHPSKLETVLVPSLLWPWALFHQKFFIWSVPDNKLFPKWSRWVYLYLKCIPLSRDGSSTNASSITTMFRVLQAGDSIILHPGGGRDYKGEQVSNSSGTRHIRTIKSTVPYLAIKNKAQILPLYIHYTGKNTPKTLKENVRWLLQSNCISFHIGQPYSPKVDMSKNDLNAVLEQKILSA